MPVEKRLANSIPNWRNLSGRGNFENPPLFFFAFEQKPLRERNNGEWRCETNALLYLMMICRCCPRHDRAQTSFFLTLGGRNFSLVITAASRNFYVDFTVPDSGSREPEQIVIPLRGSRYTVQYCTVIHPRRSASPDFRTRSKAVTVCLRPTRSRK